MENNRVEDVQKYNYILSGALIIFALFFVVWAGFDMINYSVPVNKTKDTPNLEHSFALPNGESLSIKALNKNSEGDFLETFYADLAPSGEEAILPRGDFLGRLVVHAKKHAEKHPSEDTFLLRIVTKGKPLENKIVKIVISEKGSSAILSKEY